MNFILCVYTYLATQYMYLKDKQKKGESLPPFIVNSIVVIFIIFMILLVRTIFT